MIHSMPNRSLSPFRRNSANSNSKNDTDNSLKKKKRTSLRIITNNDQQHQLVSSPTNASSRVRQRLSSLFSKNSSPAVKEPIQRSSSTPPIVHDKRASVMSLSKLSEQEEIPAALALEDNKSTDSLSSSSDNSDHMPASPADFHGNNHTSFWQNTKHGYSMEDQVKVLQAPIPPPHQIKANSLAFQVHQILGSTINEVDEEIDLDWEDSRSKLRQSLIHYPQTSQLIHF